MKKYVTPLTRASDSTDRTSEPLRTTQQHRQPSDDIHSRVHYVLGMTHAMFLAAILTTVAYAIPYVWIWGEAQCRDGANLHLSKVERVSSNAIDQTAKNYNRMDLVQARMDAFDAGCVDAVLCGPDGHLTEGSGYNIFVVRDGAVATPATNILEGITDCRVMSPSMCVASR